MPAGRDARRPRCPGRSCRGPSCTTLRGPVKIGRLSRDTQRWECVGRPMRPGLNPVDTDFSGNPTRAKPYPPGCPPGDTAAGAAGRGAGRKPRRPMRPGLNPVDTDFSGNPTRAKPYPPGCQAPPARPDRTNRAPPRRTAPGAAALTGWAAVAALHRPRSQLALGRWFLAMQAACAAGLAGAPCRRPTQPSRSRVRSAARRSPRAAGRAPRRRPADRPSPGRRAGQPDAQRRVPGQVLSAHRPWRARCRVQRMLPRAIAAKCSLARLRLGPGCLGPPRLPVRPAEASVEPA